MCCYLALTDRTRSGAHFPESSSPAAPSPHSKAATDVTTRASTSNLAPGASALELRSIASASNLLVGLPPSDPSHISSPASPARTASSRPRLADTEIEELWYLRTRGKPWPTLPTDPEPDRFELRLLAEQFWLQEIEAIVKRLDSTTKDAVSVNNEVYQLIGLFSVVQGVIFTAVTQSNLLACHRWPIPVTLSILTTLFSLLGVYSTFVGLQQITTRQKKLRKERMHRRSEVDELRRGCLNYEFKQPKIEHRSPRKIPVKAVVRLLAILSISATVNVGFREVLC
ncbi:uncharacterized protein [Physcomitrium patens]|uniref:uncharacterized protein n=1 Tax=Physcomitrium patens TaxID=3218 RepID=UPI003CCCF6B3